MLAHRGAFWRSILVGAVLLCGGAVAVSAETLTVLVEDATTGEPIGGAFVMVGPAEGEPFDGNTGWTDGSGQVVFEDPSLAFPQTVTAGAEGYGYLTIYEAAQGTVVMPLVPPEPDSTMGGTAARVEGTVSGISCTSNDGNLDIAIVLPATPVSDYALGEKVLFWTTPDTVDFPVVGPVEMPGNSYMPDQVEYYVFHFSKSPYHLDVPGGQVHTFVSLSARIPIEALVDGSAMEAAEVRECGVERGVEVNGPTTLQIASDLDLEYGLTVSFEDVPPGDQLMAVSGTLIPEGGRDLLVPFDVDGASVDSLSVFSMATMAPSGDLSDGTNAALGVAYDSSEARTYTRGIVDRSGFVPPQTVSFDSWMLVPEMQQDDRHFSWSDPTQPGVSPSPTWTRSVLGLRAADPSDSTVTTSLDWRLYARADLYGFDLPQLPDYAPGPPGGLPNPQQTPEDDILYWDFAAANPPDDPQAVLFGILEGATHWSSKWIEIQVSISSAGEPATALRGLTVAVYPSPVRSNAWLRIAGAEGGDALVEVGDASGRVLWKATVCPGREDLRFNARTLPTGAYWLRVVSSGRAAGGKFMVVR